MYSCPQCGYKTNIKQNMQTHFKRKKPCQMQENCFELNEEVIDKVLSGKFVKAMHVASVAPVEPVVPVVCNTTHINNQMVNNTFVVQYIIDGKMTTHEVIKKLEPYVNHHKYGKEILHRRLDDIQAAIEDGSDSYTFSSDKESDLLMLTEKITKCFDEKTLTDAYYSYDPKTLTYCMRSDEDISDKRHKWYWQPCTEQEILTHLLVTMKERVFDDYDTLLCRKYKANPTEMQEKLRGFFRLLNYFLIKPKCCVSRHDNEILYYPSDDEYGDHTVGFELSDELNGMYTSSLPDPWEMATIKMNILQIIKSNASAAWCIIKERVIEIVDLDRDICLAVRDRNM
jgi:hypothetical protein